MGYTEWIFVYPMRIRIYNWMIDSGVYCDIHLPIIGILVCHHC